MKFGVDEARVDRQLVESTPTHQISVISVQRVAPAGWTTSKATLSNLHTGVCRAGILHGVSRKARRVIIAAGNVLYCCADVL